MKNIIALIGIVSALCFPLGAIPADRPVAEPMGQEKKTHLRDAAAVDAQRYAAETAAIDRLCRGLNRVKADLQTLNALTTQYVQLTGRARRVTLETKNKFARPTQAAQGHVSGVEEINRLNAEVKPLKSRIASQASQISEDWRVLEEDIRFLSTSRLTGARERSCIARAQDELSRDAWILGNQTGALKSQTKESESSLSAMKIAQECDFCDLQTCKPCCENNFPVTETKNAKLAQEQKDKLARCLRDCELTPPMCQAMKDHDDNTREALGAALGILKEVKDHYLSTLKTVTGI